MLKGIVGDITGGADVCKCIPRSQFSKEDSIKFVLPHESVFIFLKSAKEEFIFTDKAFIAIRGSSGASRKRFVARYDYGEYPIKSVSFETAGFGFSDLDCELKLEIGNESFSIDIEKKETDIAISYYRALVDVSKAIKRNAAKFNLSLALNKNDTKVDVKDSPEISLRAISANIINLTETLISTYQPVSYKDVFLVHFPGA